MNKDKIINVLDGLLGTIEKDKIELYKSLIDKSKYKKFESIDDFFFGLVHPHDQFLSGLIMTEIKNNHDVCFILKHSDYIESNFVKLIHDIEGSTCSADKSGTILNRLLGVFLNGNRIEFDYNQEYTFHLPKVIFKTHEDIVSFYFALRDLYYGDNKRYLVEIYKIMNIAKDIKEEREATG